MKNKKTYYITTPIYYPSGNLHLGHAYTTSLVWTIRNYKTLRGYDAKMLTGTDEHGQKIQQKAKLENITEKAYINKMNDHFLHLWKKLEIDFDFYSRTDNDRHKESVKKIFSQLLKEKIIYKGKYKGLYSIQDEEFLTKTQAKLKEDGKYYHPISGHSLIEVSEESYFLKISQFEEWLNKEWEIHNFIRPKKVINELRNNFIKKGLDDLSITRTSFTWGITIDEDPKHVIYVWLDALTNYINSLGFKSQNDSNYNKYWKNGYEIVHVVGKEITRFHCIYWPIILKALKLKQPTSIISHGWIITDTGKMSKSKGNVIEPIALIEEFGPEILKYYLASQISMNQDGLFTKELLKNAYNSDLANNFGNLVSRTVAMTLQSFDKPIKHIEPTKSFHKDILQLIKTSKLEYIKYFDNYEVHKAFAVAINLSKNLNGYIDKTKPWTLKKDKERLSEILNNLLNGVYAVATMLSVVMPNKINQLKEQLNIQNLNLDDIDNFEKFDKIKIIKGNVIFKRIKS